MATILNKGEVFVHVPKAGGTFIRRALDHLRITQRHLEDDSSHRTTRVLKEHLNWGGNYPFIFCFVRHPLTWYESYYKFMCKRRLDVSSYPSFKHKNYPLLILENLLIQLKTRDALSFDNFIKKVLQERPGFVSELYACYDTFECSFVGKQENLRKDLITVLKSRKYKFNSSEIINFGTINKSSGIEIKWDSGLRREILATEIICLRRYNYEDS